MSAELPVSQPAPRPPTLSRRAGLALLACAALALALPINVHADPGADAIVAVVNARNPTPSLTKAEIKNIYLGTTAFWHGVVPMKVYVRQADSPAGKAFIEGVLGMNSQRFAAHWSSRELAGQGVAPERVSSPDLLAEKVKGTPGGIGFMLASEAWTSPPAGVRVIALK